jgi:hypothetical protein
MVSRDPFTIQLRFETTHYTQAGVSSLSDALHSSWKLPIVQWEARGTPGLGAQEAAWLEVV